jgi:hypothetical protein
VVEWLTILLRTLEVSGSNLGPDTCYLTDFSCEVLSSHGGEYEVQNCLLVFTDDGGNTYL